MLVKGSKVKKKFFHGNFEPSFLFVFPSGFFFSQGWAVL